MKLCSNSHFSKYYRLSIILLISLLTGCMSAETTFLKKNEFDQPVGASATYINSLTTATGAQKTNLMLLAARASLEEDRLAQANTLLKGLTLTLTTEQYNEKKLLMANLCEKEKKYDDAISLLKQIDIRKLSSQQLLRYHRTFIRCSASLPSLDSVRSYIALYPLTYKKQENIDNTWAVINQLSSAERQFSQVKSNEFILKGWLTFYETYLNNVSNPTQLKNAINQWQQKNKNHPLSTQLPSQLNYQTNTENIETGTIALLLPLSGSTYYFGNAFLSGFTDAQKSLSTLDKSANIKTYNTESAPISSLLKQIQQSSVSIIVGPLLKSDVEQLTAINPSIPVLALNQPEQLTSSSSICYFALSPEDEARSAARHIWQQHKLVPLVLRPQGEFGQRVARAFAQEWQSISGTNTAKQQIFGSLTEIKAMSNQSRGLPLTGDQILETHNINNDDLQQSELNNSIDAVYIVSTFNELILLKPMLEKNIDENMPVNFYASSRSHQFINPDDIDEHLNTILSNVEFTEIPLLSNNYDNLINVPFKHDYMLMRLYAMGWDAWQLTSHYQEIRNNPGFKLSGYSGELSFDNRCVVSRELPWMKYTQNQQ